jgi:hypothetical protein
MILRVDKLDLSSADEDFHPRPPQPEVAAPLPPRTLTLVLTKGGGGGGGARLLEEWVRVVAERELAGGVLGATVSI